MSATKRRRREDGSSISVAADTESTSAANIGESTSASVSDSVAPTTRKRFAMVCFSNMNRSMEAHKQLFRKGLMVDSYGVGGMVRLPASHGKQKPFPFGTPYRDILNDLNSAEDGGAWSRSNGLIQLLERNVGIKTAPQKWQELKSLSNKFDLVFCFEERVFDLLVEDIKSREPEDVDEPKPLHIVSLEVIDNPEEAGIGAQIALEVCQRADNAKNLEEEIAGIIEDVQRTTKRSLMHMTVFK